MCWKDDMNSGNPPLTVSPQLHAELVVRRTVEGNNVLQPAQVFGG